MPPVTPPGVRAVTPPRLRGNEVQEALGWEVQEPADWEPSEVQLSMDWEPSEVRTPMRWESSEPDASEPAHYEVSAASQGLVADFPSNMAFGVATVGQVRQRAHVDDYRHGGSAVAALYALGDAMRDQAGAMEVDDA